MQRLDLVRVADLPSISAAHGAPWSPQQALAFGAACLRWMQGVAAAHPEQQVGTPSQPRGGWTTARAGCARLACSWWHTEMQVLQTCKCTPATSSWPCSFHASLNRTLCPGAVQLRWRQPPGEERGGGGRRPAGAAAAGAWRSRLMGGERLTSRWGTGNALH